MGGTWELLPIVGEGWRCLAVRAEDTIGNIGGVASEAVRRGVRRTAVAPQIRRQPAPLQMLFQGHPYIGICPHAMDQEEALRALAAFAIPELHILRSCPAQNGSRRLRLAILPGPVFGSCSLEKSTDLGIL